MSINEFIEELKKINIIIDDKKLEQLEGYYNLVIEKNKVMNLTGITEKKDFYLKHFYDSLTINKIINLNEITTLCDIGSGAGFPGIVLKIVFPHLNITLVDSSNKRIDFLNEVIEKLNLKNIKTICTRAEEYSIKEEEKYDLVTARAVASLSIILECSIRLVKENKYFVAMKGKEEKVNEKNLENELKIKKIEEIKFTLPKEQSERTLIKYVKVNKTPKKYPRNYSVLKAKPL